MEKTQTIKMAGGIEYEVDPPKYRYTLETPDDIRMIINTARRLNVEYLNFEFGENEIAITGLSWDRTTIINASILTKNQLEDRDSAIFARITCRDLEGLFSTMPNAPYNITARRYFDESFSVNFNDRQIIGDDEIYQDIHYSEWYAAHIRAKLAEIVRVNNADNCAPFLISTGKAFEFRDMNDFGPTAEIGIFNGSMAITNTAMNGKIIYRTVEAEGKDTRFKARVNLQAVEDVLTVLDDFGIDRAHMTIREHGPLTISAQRNSTYIDIHTVSAPQL